MKDYSTKINLILKCKQEEIPGVLKLCEDHISKKMTETDPEHRPLESTIMAKIKWVISEMLLNAVKHSGVDKCLLKIMIDEKQLTIVKEDSGKPLALNDFDTGKRINWPLKETAENLNFQIYHNGMDSLRVRTDTRNKATFFIAQLPDVEMPGLLVDISEHFGLLIIAKASDEFTYERDPYTNANRFISNFNLK